MFSSKPPALHQRQSHLLSPDDDIAHLPYITHKIADEGPLNQQPNFKPQVPWPVVGTGIRLFGHLTPPLPAHRISKPAATTILPRWSHFVSGPSYTYSLRVVVLPLSPAPPRDARKAARPQLTSVFYTGQNGRARPSAVRRGYWGYH